MTTPAAASQYLANHLTEMKDRKIAIFNPNNIEIEKLPVIYGFNNGGHPNFLRGYLISEDGENLGMHICSDELYMLCDLGILEGTSAGRHETFRAHYPNGYRMEFVSHEDVKNHKGLTRAIELNKE